MMINRESCRVCTHPTIKQIKKRSNHALDWYCSLQFLLLKVLTHTQHFKNSKTIFSRWMMGVGTLQCYVAPSLSSRYHPSFVPGSSHLARDPSVSSKAYNLTTHLCLSKKSLPLCAHFSLSLFQFSFTKCFKFYQCLLCWFSRKRDTGIPQHCNSQITSSEPGSLELAAPHRSPEAVASVPGRWPTR